VVGRIEIAAARRLLAACTLIACSQPSQPATQPRTNPAADKSAGDLPGRDAVAPADVAVDVAQLERDGNDDVEDPGTGTLPAAGTFEKVGTPPLALDRICDLTPLGDSLYAAHARSPLASDGATITRYTPGAKKPFTVAFDWNRPGERKWGGGAGQGFLRVHAIDGRLFVPDSDPPYNGLGIVEKGTEGYVFVSTIDGTFPRARMPGHRPPGDPDLSEPAGAGGAAVLPRAYHVLDVMKFRGGLFASTGSVPPTERAWHGPSPGALHRANKGGARWLYEVDYPFPYQDGVWRLTFMVRFRDRLYAGIQDYDNREPNDYIVIEPPATEPTPAVLTHEQLRAVRVTDTGAAGTIRWWVDSAASPPRLYWLAWDRGEIVIRFTTDGDAWQTLDVPAGAGRPSDITRFRDGVVVLTEHGLWKVDGTRLATTPIAEVKGKPSPFEVSDLFCAAPLSVFRNELYAGGQHGGTLYKLVELKP
jgi:hypothetical protein